MKKKTLEDITKRWKRWKRVDRGENNTKKKYKENFETEINVGKLKKKRENIKRKRWECSGKG